jgi:NADH dehydrogenase
VKLVTSNFQVVIIGGGFAGLTLARALRRAPVDVTLIDKRNFHLFQPLLYQVATGGLSNANIAIPIRSILSRQGNARVLLADITGIDPLGKLVHHKDGTVPFDTLVVATGSDKFYFGHDDWQHFAPGLKTIEDALVYRNKVMMAFETAELETDPKVLQELLTFVVVGAGPTGVELAGALADIKNLTLKHDFRSINPSDAKIYVIDAEDRVLPTYPEDLSQKAAASLEKIGVTVIKKAMVTEITDREVTIKRDDKLETIPTRTVLWAAGIKASPLGRILSESTGAGTDRMGRVIVEEDCTVKGHPEIFVIGDLAHFKSGDTTLPAVAPVAMQQGRYVAKLIRNRIQGKSMPGFSYRDMGTLATIGRNAAVAEIGGLHFSGFPAWLIWLFVHLMAIVEFGNRLLIVTQWGWNYFTWRRSARLITNLCPDDRIKPE